MRANSHRAEMGRVYWRGALGLVAAYGVPGLAIAQASPFMTGMTSLQSNILAWLTPLAIILVMVLGAMAMASRIVENCGNTLILRCSSSQHGGTASFASRLIGQREVLRTSRSQSKRPTEWSSSTTRAQHLAIEPAVMDSEIEQLADCNGYLKLTSMPQWMRVTLALASPVVRQTHAEHVALESLPGVTLSATARASAEAREAWRQQRNSHRSARPAPPAAPPVATRGRTRAAAQPSPETTGAVRGR